VASFAAGGRGEAWSSMRIASARPVYEVKHAGIYSPEYVCISRETMYQGRRTFRDPVLENIGAHEKPSIFKQNPFHLAMNYRCFE
jgi:hypothetical protein